ncbi:MAG: adenylate kinase [Firmicutes bacterium]|nr:adenylate kinase [Bacillota bacterium]
MHLVLIGPPGAGKGTQGEILSKKLGIGTISTGVMLRTAIKEQSEVGKIAQMYINDGKLVPDEVIVNIVKDRLSQPDCQKGFILDGFPRTIAQAKALSAAGVKIDKVLSIEVEDEKIVERLSQRRECSKCGAPYNLMFNKPQVDGVCDKCGGNLIQRADDTEATINKRLDVYHSEAEPIKEYYKELGLLVSARGEEEIADTTRNVVIALGIEE